MPFTRSLFWASAVRALKADRMIVPPGLASARAMAKVYSKNREFSFVLNGQYNRSAVMKTASLAARHHQKRCGCSWHEAMGVALKATWQLAKVAKLSKHLSRRYVI